MNCNKFIHLLMKQQQSMSITIIIYESNNYSLEANIRAGKVEHRLGLKPRSLGVWPSAFTFRPPTVLAPCCSLALLRA